MPSIVEIVPATLAHAHAMAPHMRLADAEEVLASGGYSPLEALLDAVRHSEHSFAAYIHSELAALFGVSSRAIGFESHPWCLTTPVVERYPVAFFRACRLVVGTLREAYPLLTNAIDARHVQAVRWALRLGFELEDPRPFGRAGLPFHPISIRRLSCANQ